MEAQNNARTVYRDRKANSAKYMSTLNTQDDENALQPTSEPWLRFGGKAPPFFDVTTSYNSVDRAAWLGKVTSQRHA
jgi:hypothetical protein